MDGSRPYGMPCEAFEERQESQALLFDVFGFSLRPDECAYGGKPLDSDTVCFIQHPLLYS